MKIDRKKKKPEPAPTFPLNGDQKGEENCALDPLPVLKNPLYQGNRNFPLPPSEGDQKTLLQNREREEPETSFRYKNYKSFLASFTNTTKIKNQRQELVNKNGN